MNVLVKIAWRSVWRNRRRTIITVVAIALAMGIAVFFLALADGMYGSFIRSVTRMQAGNVTVQHARYQDAPAIDLVVSDASKWRERLDALPEVERTVTLVSGQGVVTSGSSAVGAAIVGVDPEVEVQRSPLPKKMVAGAYLEPNDTRKIVLGEEMAKRLEVKLGNKIVLTTNDAHGELIQQLVRVKGIFKTGSIEIDAYFVQIPIKFARKVFNIGPDEATQLGMVLHRNDDQARVLAKVREMMRGEKSLAALPWQKVMPDLAAFMEVDKGSNYVFQGIILFLMLFTIFNTIMMSVLERTHEFAVMLAVGTTPRRLKLQLLLEAVFLGMFGSLVGLGIGGAGAYYFQVNGLDMSSMMQEGMDVAGFAFDPIIRAKVTAEMLIGMGSLVLVATVLLSLVPMTRIRRINLAGVLR